MLFVSNCSIPTHKKKTERNIEMLFSSEICAEIYYEKLKRREEKKTYDK